MNLMTPMIARYKDYASSKTNKVSQVTSVHQSTPLNQYQQNIAISSDTSTYTDGEDIVDVDYFSECSLNQSNDDDDDDEEVC